MPESSRDYYGGNYMKINDVILLEKGTMVYCKGVPEYYTKNVNPHSSRLVNGLMKVGTPVTRPIACHDLRERIAGPIIDMFLYYGIHVQTDILNRFLAHQIKDFGDDSFLVPEGLYRITEMIMERQGRRILCKTYRPNEERPELEIYFYVGTHDPANQEHVKIVTDAERDI